MHAVADGIVLHLAFDDNCHPWTNLYLSLGEFAGDCAIGVEHIGFHVACHDVHLAVLLMLVDFLTFDGEVTGGEVNGGLYGRSPAEEVVEEDGVATHSHIGFIDVLKGDTVVSKLQRICGNVGGCDGLSGSRQTPRRY